jgi:hypothetical protein
MSTRRSRFLLTSLRRYRRLRSPPPRTPSDPFGPAVVGIFTRSHMAGLLQSPGGPFPCRPTSTRKTDWVEGGIAAPSALRNVASPITGTTLQRSIPVDWRSTGTEVHERVWGWQPRHIQESVWTTDPFTDRTVILTVNQKITIRAPVIGIFVDRKGNRCAYSADPFLSPRVRHYLLSGQTSLPSWPGVTGE